MIWDIVDHATRIALLILLPLAYFGLRRNVTGTLTTFNTRLTKLESDVKKLQGMSTLPQATRAEVESDIKKALNPLMQQLDHHGTLMAEIRAMIQEQTEEAHARHTSTSGAAQSN